MRKIEITADQLVSGALKLSDSANICVLDSCGVGKPGTNRLIVGIDPIEIHQLRFADALDTLEALDGMLGSTNLAAIFTISYDFGLKLQQIPRRSNRSDYNIEPDIFLALFDSLAIHDYDNGQTYLTGNPGKFDRISDALTDAQDIGDTITSSASKHRSNFTKHAYLEAIDEVKELIRSGETYQANLTQQLSLDIPEGLTAAEIFGRLRRNHPAPFAAYIDRGSSKVVSASPERFIGVKSAPDGERTITSSPIKGTRRRGASEEEDNRLRSGLINSEKDRAENTMIVDLMRNDLGRICRYGSVEVESLCELETHPTLFHLVSTVRGVLRDRIGYSDILKAVFPCGSITGAPKIRTMRIIEEIEDANRGLSMGAIGVRIPEKTFNLPETFEMSVAIRTMVIREQTAVFNVGGGIVIDSDAESEYDESMLKAKALLNALKAK